MNPLVLPWLPPGRTVLLPSGEVFVRWHQHPDPSRPTVVLLHGWTASADLQFFTAYRGLAEHYSFLAIDHRGHGRGLRSTEPFRLEDAADDAAGALRALGISSAVAVGYSMGGPIAMLMARRHPDLVAGVVVEATALEWRASRVERLRWKTVSLAGPMLRSWAYARWLRYAVAKLIGADHSLAAFVPWIVAETRRNDSAAIVQAGHALGRYDARPWVAELRIPAGALVMTKDRLVLPRKQRALADALHAHVIDLDGDHLAAWEVPDEFSAATVALVDHVTNRRIVVEPTGAPGSVSVG